MNHNTTGSSVQYRQCTEEEARGIAARFGCAYIPENLHLYKYPTKESWQMLKAQTPLLKVLDFGQRVS